MSITCNSAWHTQSRVVHTEIQPKLGHVWQDEHASSKHAEADGRIHVDASVEGGRHSQVCLSAHIIEPEQAVHWKGKKKIKKGGH
jgi:hypothetical protein